MSIADNILKSIYSDLIENGDVRETRTGAVHSKFGYTGEIDLSESFEAAVTCKKLMFNSVVGELLWFLSGDTDLRALRHRSCLHRGARTIWSDDFKRWVETLPEDKKDYHLKYESLGRLYGEQWRNFNCVDQIDNLIQRLVENPSRRDMIVTSYNPYDVEFNRTALQPCHSFFQVYVNNGLLDLQYYQRSCDVFLGLPFNLASYGTLIHILADAVGLKAGRLRFVLGDYHLYANHIDAAKQFIHAEPFEAPKLQLKTSFVSMTDDIDGCLMGVTADDFELVGYEHGGVIKAPLSVG